MDTNDLFPVIILALIVNSIILSLVISYATRTNKKMKHMEAQTLLLIQIAMKQNVDPEQLKRILESLDGK